MLRRARCSLSEEIVASSLTITRDDKFVTIAGGRCAATEEDDAKRRKRNKHSHIGATIKIIVNGIAIAFNESYLDS